MEGDVVVVDDLVALPVMVCLLDEGCMPLTCALLLVVLLLLLVENALLRLQSPLLMLFLLR